MIPLRKLTIAIAILVLSSVLFEGVHASYTVPQRPVYFPSKDGSYITFETDLLPLSFWALYKDTNVRWHFNSRWITTTVDMTITCYFTDNWLRYSINEVGTQEIYYGGEPSEVFIDSALIDKDRGWSYANGIITVIIASNNVSLNFGTASGPPKGGPHILPPVPRPENWTWVPPFLTKPRVTPEYVLRYGFFGIVAIVLFTACIGIISHFAKSSRKALYNAKMKTKRANARDYQKRMKKPKR